MERIIVLNIRYNFGDTEDFIHPVVLLDDKDMVLVDCGYVGFLDAVENALTEENLDCSRITKIVITHQDHDHMGSLAAFKRKYPGIQVVAGKIEAPYITGVKKSLRLKQAESMQKMLPEDQKAFGHAFCNILKKVEPAGVDIPVQDCDFFSWCGGCKIVATPGHTPGHISLFLENKRTVITGDAAVLENNQLKIANPQFTLDMKKAEESLLKLSNLSADTFICYHGGIYEKKKERRSKK